MEEIASREYPEGGRFLSNRRICKKWKVDQWTVDRSIEFLKKEGVLAARPRSGYHLAPGAIFKAMILAQRHTAAPLPEVDPWWLRIEKPFPRRRKRVVVIFDSSRRWLQRGRLASMDTAFAASRSGIALWDAFTREADARGDCLDRLLLPGDALSRAALLSYLDDHRWEGAIFVRRMCYPEAFEAATQFFEEISLPCVTVFERAGGTSHPCVSVNYAGLAYEAVATLVRSGMERVIVVDNLKGRSDSRELRLLGAALAAGGEEAGRQYLFRLSHEKEDVIPPALLELLGESRRVRTGLVVFNHELFTKIEAEIIAGRRPEAVRLFTISGERRLNASKLHERLSVMAFDYQAIAREAYRALCHRMEGMQARHTLLRATLQA